MPVFLCGHAHGASGISFADGFGELFGAADDQQANIIFCGWRGVSRFDLAEEAHEEVNFRLGAAPIFEREGVEGEARAA